MRKKGRQGIHNSEQSLTQPGMVGQPQGHPRQDAIVKEKRLACALELPEPGIILTDPVWNVPGQQFGSLQSLRHATAGDGIEESCSVAKKRQPGSHATTGLSGQRRSCENGSDLLGPLQALGKLWFRKQPTSERALDRFNELLCVCQDGNKHFTSR